MNGSRFEEGPTKREIEVGEGDVKGERGFKINGFGILLVGGRYGWHHCR